LHSWTIPFAALTGVFLWQASLVAGWAANWSAFRRLPEALATHRRLLALLGPDRCARLGRLVEQNISGVAGYTALGFLLGFMPVVFTFMGLGVEVRHVTLSAASLALSVASPLAAGHAPWRDLAWAMAGLACVGVLNFSVSFLLALRTALGARGIDERGRAGLRRKIWLTFRRNPMRFLGPPPL
jgi:site-specific recombinase